MNVVNIMLRNIILKSVTKSYVSKSNLQIKVLNLMNMQILLNMMKNSVMDKIVQVQRLISSAIQSILHFKKHSLYQNTYQTHQRTHKRIDQKSKRTQILIYILTTLFSLAYSFQSTIANSKHHYTKVKKNHKHDARKGNQSNVKTDNQIYAQNENQKKSYIHSKNNTQTHSNNKLSFKNKLSNNENSNNNVINSINLANSIASSTTQSTTVKFRNIIITIHGLKNCSPEDILYCLKFDKNGNFREKDSIEEIIHTNKFKNVKFIIRDNKDFLLDHIDQKNHDSEDKKNEAAKQKHVDVYVTENKIINKIEIHGIKSDSFKRILESIEISSLSSGDFINEEQLNAVYDGILSYFSNKGYFNAKVIIKTKNNAIQHDERQDDENFDNKLHDKSTSVLIDGSTNAKFTNTLHNYKQGKQVKTNSIKYSSKHSTSNHQKKSRLKHYKNSIDITIKVEKNSKAKVRKIHFIGNKKISTNTLADIIRTRKTQIYHLLSDIIVNDESIETDCMIIEHFYASKGYMDAKITDAKAILSKSRKYFIVNFHIEEGARYKIKNVSYETDLATQNNMRKNEENKLGLYFHEVCKKHLVGKYFSKNKLNDTTQILQKNLLKIREFYISSDFEQNENDKTVSIKYTISSNPNLCVKSIKISGNKAIPEKFIRRQFKFSEGSRYYSIDPYELESLIMSTGFFENVKVDIIETKSKKLKNHSKASNQNNSGIQNDSNDYSTKNISIKIQVKEKQFIPSLKIFGGYSQVDGMFLEFAIGVKKHNFNTNVSTKIASLYRDIQFQIDNNPDENDTLYDYRIYLISDVRKSKGSKNEKRSIIKDTTSMQSEQEYDSFSRNTFGSSIFILFPISSNIQYGPEISFSYQDISANKKMSKMFIKQSGRYLITQLGHQIKFHDLDSFRNPRNGYTLAIKNALFINNTIEGKFPVANTMRTSLSINTYKSFNKNKSIYNHNIIEIGFINKFNSKKQIRILDKFFVSDTSMKGMHPVDGCGPKNLYGRNSESVGGTKYIGASFNFHMPFTKKLTKSGLSWFVFTDVLSIFDTSIPNRSRKIIQDGMKFNVSTGAGVSISFGMGSLMIYFAYPLFMHKKDTPMYFGLSMS